MTPRSAPDQRNAAESHDGFGCGDHDETFVFGRLPRALAPFPFSTHEFARLMVLRSRVQAGVFGRDDTAQTFLSDALR